MQQQITSMEMKKKDKNKINRRIKRKTKPPKNITLSPIQQIDEFLVIK